MREGARGAWIRAMMVAVDALLVNAAFVASYLLRYELGMGREVAEYNYVPLPEYLLIEVSLTLILVAVYTIAGLYRRPMETGLLDEVTTLLGATSIGVLLTLALVFMYQGYAYSRLMFLYLWVLTIAFLLLARGGRDLLRMFLYQRGIGVQRVLVVGGGQFGLVVMHVVATEAAKGYHLVGFVSQDGSSNIGRFRCLGQLDDLHRVVHEHGVSEVIIALPSTLRRHILDVMHRCQQEGVNFKLVPDLYELSLSRVDVNDLRGLPLIGLRQVSIRGFNLVVKRVMDVGLAVSFLIGLSPLLILIALLVKVDSAGPVFFRQTRVGKAGRPFLAYKFRSMRVGADREVGDLSALNEASGPLFKMRRDPRVTRVGRWLRRTSLDESPQLINVLRGDMSLVGPRPPLPREVAQYSEWHRKRLAAAPGLTGLWQVSGRSELPFDEMVMLDIYYIENWSLSLDLQILLRTVPAVLSGRGAY